MRCQYPELMTGIVYSVFANTTLHMLATQHFRCSWISHEWFSAWLMKRPKGGHSSNLIALVEWAVLHVGCDRLKNNYMYLY
jgi:hypothetical protein